MPTVANGPEPQPPLKSNRFWFNNGTVLVSLVSSVYKVHKSILDGHSTKLATWLLDVTDPTALALSRAIGDAETPIIAIPAELGVTIEDFEMLLVYLYHDS